MTATILTEEGSLNLQLRPDGRLLASKDGVERVVWVRQAFPWSEPRQFLSLRDDEEEEFAMVPQLGALDPASRRALERALVVAGFVFDVTRVLSVEEEVEVRHWKVETSQGPRTFQTRLDDWPRMLPPGGLLIRDVAGDLYHLADPDALDRQSLALLWAFMD
jgi:hypothetical protein